MSCTVRPLAVLTATPCLMCTSTFGAPCLLFYQASSLQRVWSYLAAQAPDHPASMFFSTDGHGDTLNLPSCHAGATNPDGVTPRHYGWWMGDDATILGANTVWILVIFGWTMGMMLPFFYGLKLCGWLRVSAEEELVSWHCQL